MTYNNKTTSTTKYFTRLRLPVVALQLLIYFCPLALFKTNRASNALADNTDRFLVRVFPLSTSLPWPVGKSLSKLSTFAFFKDLHHNHDHQMMLMNIISMKLDYQWCSRDRNLRDRDRDLTQISKRDQDRDFVIKTETETWKFETETRDLTFLGW